MTDDASALDVPCRALDLALGAEVGVTSTVLRSTAFLRRNFPVSAPEIAAWEGSAAVALASLLSYGVDTAEGSSPGGAPVALMKRLERAQAAWVAARPEAAQQTIALAADHPPDQMGPSSLTEKSSGERAGLVQPNVLNKKRQRAMEDKRSCKRTTILIRRLTLHRDAEG